MRRNPPPSPAAVPDPEPTPGTAYVKQAEQKPYADLVNACGDDPVEIQRVYAAHRSRRNAQERERFLDPGFSGLTIDQYLLRLERPALDPGFCDDRHCLVLWARPPNHILRLAARLQDMLKHEAPGIWLMPTDRMHLTTFEVAFSKTPDEIASLLSALRPVLLHLTSYTLAHRARLVKPFISYDLSAFSLSFLPSAGEPSLSPAPTPPDPLTHRGPVAQDDCYTYHHLRRDIFDIIAQTGVPITSRYQVPSAHITLGRYLDDVDHDTPEKRERWIAGIERINQWLENEVWNRLDAELVGEWVVGHEKGLDARSGALWYGGGRTVMMGEGF